MTPRHPALVDHIVSREQITLLPTSSGQSEGSA